MRRLCSLLQLLLLISVIFAAASAVAWYFGLWETQTAKSVWSLIRDNKLPTIAGGLVSAAWGVWKAFEYAEARLPYQLLGFLERFNQSSHIHRTELLATATGQIAGLTTPIGGSPGRDSRRRAKLRKYLAELDAAPSQPDGPIAHLQKTRNVSELALRNASYALATAHFIRGVEYSNSADQAKSPDQSRRSALHEFEQAIRLDASDLRLHQSRVALHEKIGNADELPAAVEGWIVAAANSKQPREEARARLRRAELFLDSSFGPSLNQQQRRELRRPANANLSKAIELLENNPDGVSVGRDRLLAQAFRKFAELREAMNAPSHAIEHYSKALGIYTLLSDQVAIREIQTRLGELGVITTTVAPSLQVAAIDMLKATIAYADARSLAGQKIDAQRILNGAEQQLAQLYETGAMDLSAKCTLDASIFQAHQRARADSNKIVRSPTPTS